MISEVGCIVGSVGRSKCWIFRETKRWIVGDRRGVQGYIHRDTTALGVRIQFIPNSVQGSI